jgi:hypothetical protein
MSSQLMQGKRRLTGLAATIAASAVGLLASVVSVQAEQYVTAEVTVNIEVWPEKIWDYFRFFCSALVINGERSTCLTAGDGVSAIRQIPDGREDLLIAKGPLSQTYEVIAGAMAALDLHVTLSVVAREDPLTSTITATMVWDEEPVPENERLAVQYDITSSVAAQLTDAKYQAEAS